MGAMVQNEMNDSKSDNPPITKTKIESQSLINKPVKDTVDKKAEYLSEKKTDLNAAVKESEKTSKIEPAINKVVNDSASILNLIQMVDNKIDKLKDETSKEDASKKVASRGKDSVNDDYQRRIMESIMENELAMEQNQAVSLETSPPSSKDNPNNLSVNTPNSKDAKTDNISEKKDEKKDVLSSKPT